MILITGATGFIGWNLCKRLTELALPVVPLGSPNENFIAEWPVKEVPWSKLTALVHLAAETDTTAPDERQAEVNLRYAQRTISHAIDSGVKRIVYASSCAIYGNGPKPFREDQEPTPCNAYGQAKAELDLWAMSIPFSSITGLRFSNVYGPGETHKGKAASMVTQLLNKVTARERPKLFKYGSQSRDWVYVKDVADGIVAALEYSGKGVFNIAAGQNHTFNYVLGAINNQLGTSIAAEYIDNPHQGYQEVTEVDISKARQILNWKPRYNLTEGIKDYVESMA